MEAWGISLQPGPRCPNGRKSEIVFIPSRDPTYAPVVQTLRASAAGFREGAEGRIPIKPMADRANRLQCSALHFCASAGRGGPRAAFQLLLLDKWGHFRSKVGFKPGFLRLAL